MALMRRTNRDWVHVQYQVVNKMIKADQKYNGLHSIVEVMNMSAHFS